MELKLQDYEIGDFIKINDKHLAIITNMDKFSLFATCINFPHKENQLFVITDKYLSNIKRVTHV
jgi:hypothetical protein